MVLMVPGAIVPVADSCPTKTVFVTSAAARPRATWSPPQPRRPRGQSRVR
jgi:hypothetical protein